MTRRSRYGTRWPTTLRGTSRREREPLGSGLWPAVPSSSRSARRRSSTSAAACAAAGSRRSPPTSPRRTWPARRRASSRPARSRSGSARSAARRARAAWPSCRPRRRSARASCSARGRRAVARHGARAAQVLLTAADVRQRATYVNARSTLETLLAWDVIPVVNENDSTATDEITFGDNDALAAQVAVLTHARLLVLLTDQEGLYTRDPRQAGAELVREVNDHRLLDELEVGGSGSSWGSGGMRSKVVAAEMASAGGVATVIAHGAHGRRRGRGDRRRGVGTRFRGRRARGVVVQAVDPVRPARRPGGSRSTRAPGRRSSATAARCCRSASRARPGGSRPATRSRSPTRPARCSRAAWPSSRRPRCGAARASAAASPPCTATTSCCCARTPYERGHKELAFTVLNLYSCS